ncbi:MAG: phasin family protein [Dongiaceae bacterium]
MTKTSPQALNGDFFKFPDYTQFFADFGRSYGEFGKMFGNGKTPVFDIEAMLASQRKNVEALTAANQAAIEGVQAVTRRQMEIAQRAVEEFSQAGMGLTSTGSAEDRVAKQAATIKEVFEAALANVRELTDIMQKSGNEAVEVLSKRVYANLDEMQTTFAAKTAQK